MLAWRRVELVDGPHGILFVAGRWLVLKIEVPNCEDKYPNNFVGLSNIVYTHLYIYIFNHNLYIRWHTYAFKDLMTMISFQVNQLKRPAISNLLEASWSTWCGRHTSPDRVTFLCLKKRSLHRWCFCCWNRNPLNWRNTFSQKTPEVQQRVYPWKGTKTQKERIVFQSHHFSGAVNFQGCFQWNFGWKDSQPEILQNRPKHKIIAGFEGISGWKLHRKTTF